MRKFEEIDEAFGHSSYGKEKYSEAELYWIGYLYRYWSYTYQKTSKQVYRFIKPKAVGELHYPHHSLDPAQAIERILKAEGASDGDFTERGVKILREIKRRKPIAKAVSVICHTDG